MYWLRHDEFTFAEDNAHDKLMHFANCMNLKLSDATFHEAAKQLDLELVKGDIEQWIVYICFTGHPHLLWNLMLDAVALAQSDEHLQKIATSLAEHILAHYGSMVDDFENWASTNERFRRMLTGAWRHRMSDDVWQRLRTLQSGVSNPLGSLVPLENGVEYMADHLSPKDRETADKGRYLRDENGVWQKTGWS